MNLSKADAVALAQGLAAGSADKCDVLVCPTPVYVDAVSTAVAGSHVAVGGQDVYFEGNGAFTGETSTAMLKDLCLLYTSPSPRDRQKSRMPSSA